VQRLRAKRTASGLLAPFFWKVGTLSFNVGKLGDRAAAMIDLLAVSALFPDVFVFVL
jgi:hypothetical protein